MAEGTTIKSWLIVPELAECKAWTGGLVFCHSARSPLPHSEHRLLGQWISALAGHHGDLPAVVRVMSDQVADEADHIGAKTFDASITFEHLAHENAESPAALLQSAQRLRRRDISAIQLFGNADLALAASRGRLQPHNAHIMHMRNDGRNRAAFAANRRGFPCCLRDGVDQILIDAVVGVESVQ